MSKGTGYNPYRDAAGKFTSPENVGAKVESDLREAQASGDGARVEAIENYAMEKMPESDLGRKILEGKYGQTSSRKRYALSPRERGLREASAKLARDMVNKRAEYGEVAFDSADPERSRRRLNEAIEYAKSRGNTHLLTKLSSATVLPSGAFQRKSDKKRVNTDAVIKAYVAENSIEEGRARIIGAIQSKIDAGAIQEGKYEPYRDASGTYSLSVKPGFDGDAFERLPENVKTAISSPRTGMSIELARERLSAEQFEAVTSKQQVMDFVVGKKPDIGEPIEAKAEITGTGQEAATSGLKSLSSYLNRVEAVYGKKKERTERKAEAIEIMKSSVAGMEGNTFIPGRAYGNGALVTSRTVLNPKAVAEVLSPQEMKSITVTGQQPDPEKAKRILSKAQYESIFERMTASVRVTPKREPKAPKD